MMNKTTGNTAKEIQAIVWDWNGTLLDDVHVCVDSINQMLRPRNIPLLNYETYRRVFGFPVRDYYEKAGFNFTAEAFDVVAVEFIDIYRERITQCGLFRDVLPVLGQVTALKLPQYVLSAMEQELLEESLNNKGIAHFFQFIAGTGDHYADGKLGSAKRLQQIIGIEPEKILMIGDTIHDHEVASEMGWESVIIANGHQSEERLKKTGRLVLDSLSGVTHLLNGHSC
jgi:phosphoglycolate phosphatase